MSVSPARLSVLSSEYVTTTVTIAIGNFSLPTNPTNDTVSMAFMRIDDIGNSIVPAAGDWKAASWLQLTAPYIIQCLVGPLGVVQLTAGTYYVWTRIIDNPETIIKRLNGSLVMY